MSRLSAKVHLTRKKKVANRGQVAGIYVIFVTAVIVKPWVDSQLIIQRFTRQFAFAQLSSMLKNGVLGIHSQSIPTVFGGLRLTQKILAKLGYQLYNSRKWQIVMLRID